MNQPITIHRYFWGQLKLWLDFIKLRPWHDRPFFEEWRHNRDCTTAAHTNYLHAAVHELEYHPRGEHHEN